MSSGIQRKVDEMMEIETRKVITGSVSKSMAGHILDRKSEEEKKKEIPTTNGPSRKEAQMKLLSRFLAWE